MIISLVSIENHLNLFLSLSHTWLAHWFFLDKINFFCSFRHRHTERVYHHHYRWQSLMQPIKEVSYCLLIRWVIRQAFRFTIQRNECCCTIITPFRLVHSVLFIKIANCVCFSNFCRCCRLSTLLNLLETRKITRAAYILRTRSTTRKALDLQECSHSES